MTPERWKEVERIYYASKRLEVGQREAFLDHVCDGDKELRQEIASLLESDAEAGSFLAEPAAATVAGTTTSETNSSLRGRHLGHYRVISLLGAGGMGEVYLAQDTRLGRRVAIKLLPVEYTADAGRVRRFSRESRAASALNHPNIITIHEIGEVDSTHYIVTEYVAGETLRQRMRAAPQQRMTVAETLDIVVQIVSALVAAHGAGIAHRDIKPENIMVRPDGYVKVLDFGIAKLIEPLTPIAGSQPHKSGTQSSDEGMVVGTPRYMSPEQARGENVDYRTDIFSLGVVLYEMIAGCLPFFGETANDAIAAILRDEPLPLSRHTPEAGSGLEHIVSRALRKKSADRYQTAAELLGDLKQLQQGIELQPKRGIATWISPRRQPLLSEKDSIVLADFENRTGDPVFDVTLKQALAIQLEQSPFLSRFPEERVRQTLRLMERSPEERVTAGIAREICVRHNLKALIAGSIVALGSHYVITLEAVHGQTGETLESEQIEARSKEQVLRALSRASTRLRAKLGESLKSIQQFDKGLEETTTQKLEAFQAYSLGYEQSLRGRMMDAIQLYRRAVELDPEFAYAWSMLSVHHSLTGRSELAAEYAAKAYELRARVSEYEQQAITFRYHFMHTGDMNKAIDAAVLFKRTYPRTSTAPIDLLVAYDVIGRHDLAVGEGREAIGLNPNYAPAYWYLGRALLRVNDFTKAKDTFTQAIAQKFDFTNIHSALYLIAFLEHDSTGMRQHLEWAVGKPEAYVAFDWQAGVAAFSGQWRKAQEFSRHAIDEAARGDTKELAARYATEQALRGAALGDRMRAKAYAIQGLNIAAVRTSLPRAALALALCGETAQVEALIGEAVRRYPADSMINSIWLPTIRGALQLERGHAAQAIEELQTTTSYEASAEFWPQYLRGLAYLKLGRAPMAVAEFQKILDHRGYAPLSPLYPLAQLGVSRAAALEGDLFTSQKNRDDFLAAWKDADPDLSILIDAKREFETQ